MIESNSEKISKPYSHLNDDEFRHFSAAVISSIMLYAEQNNISDLADFKHEVYKLVVEALNKSRPKICQ